MSDQPSKLIPTDPFDQALSRLIDLPNGGHTNATAVQAVDFYGNVTAFMIQTVRTELGDTIFVTQVNAAGSARYIIPPEVLRVVDRQREAVLAQVRRRHGKRLVESGVLKAGGGFTPEARAKGLATRKAKAAKRKARKEKRHQ
jgi:hypothetical protein